MRILLTSHAPLDQQGSILGTLNLAHGLCAAGHAIHGVLVDSSRDRDVGFPVSRVVCGTGATQPDLTFSAPSFAGEARFSDLSSTDAAAYREAFRRALDAEIASFDPHVIHCDHLWLPAHLALESGVSYVVTVHDDDFVALAADPRYRRIAVEAAENAGRIIAPDEATARRVSDLCGDLEGRVVEMPSIRKPDREVDEATVNAIVALYAAVLDERLGRQWRA